MKIVTWNINGIRATKKPLKDILQSLDADIICLQETKITRDLLESDIALVDGYNSYFSFSKKRSGYSGVATYCRNSCLPVRAQSGLTNFYELEAGNGKIGCYGKQGEMFSDDRRDELDKEGRAVLTQHKINCSDGRPAVMTVINVYCPRADPEKPERRTFKLDFYKLLEERARAIKKIPDNYVVIVGDMNVSHRQIDHCDPNDPIMFYDNPARLWMDNFLLNNGDYSKLQSQTKNPNIATNGDQDDGGIFIDSFRYFYPKKQDMFTCWCTSNRARQTNYGTRIDYIFVDHDFAAELLSCDIITDFQGSDHCPVKASLKCEAIAGTEYPDLCTKMMTEYVGKQQTLSKYLVNPVEQKESNKKVAELFKPNKKTKTSKRPSQTTLGNFFKKPKVENNNDIQKVQDSVHNVSQPSRISAPSKNVDVQFYQNNKERDFTKSTSDIKTSRSKNTTQSVFWKNVLKGPGPSPPCAGHNEPCVLRTVKKKGPNLGKQFYCCSRPEGHRSNPEANCQHFEWKKAK